MKDQDHGLAGRTALLVVDVQRGLFKRPNPVFEAEKLLENINALIDRAHGKGVPVCFIQHTNHSILPAGSENWQLHPGLHCREEDLHFYKLQGSAFAGTELLRVLAERGIEVLWVTGLVSHGCVKATCIDAYARGFRVILVEDGHSNFHSEAAKIIADCNRELSSQGIVALASSQALLTIPARTLEV